MRLRTKRIGLTATRRYAERGIWRCRNYLAAAWALLLALSLFFSGGAVPVFALDKPGDERARLKACEKQLCSIILKRRASGDDLACNIGRTWEKSKIVNGVRQKRISWSFGDAQCRVAVKMPRAGIISALTKPNFDLQLAKHTINCQVEREEGVSDVTLRLAPKMAFKAGKVDKIWLNVSEIEAPTIIKGAIWTVSQLEANIGVFHGEMVDEVNEFIHQKCAKRYPN